MAHQPRTAARTPSWLAAGNSQAVSSGAHDMFVAGNDPAAKTAATDLLGRYRWRSVIDVGDIAAARGREMMLPCS
jgi:predicted dinucleotide-binding enzyme